MIFLLPKTRSRGYSGQSGLLCVDGQHPFTGNFRFPRHALIYSDRIPTLVDLGNGNRALLTVSEGKEHAISIFISIL